MVPMYELWLFENDMIYESTTHEYVALYECYRHVRHIGFESDFGIEYLVYEHCACLTWF